MTKQTYKHWQLNKDDKDTLWLTFDRSDASANSISNEVLDELDTILDNLDGARAIVFQSGKSNGFIMGADVQSFSDMSDVSQAMTFIRKGQKLFDKLEGLSIPTVAMIDGYCLGGGMELALACRYRVAEESDKTRLGLPEVKLGIHPGWGGTVRLPKMIGAISALDVILTGRMVKAKAAKKMGMVDAAVPKRHLLRAVEYYIAEQPSVQRVSGFKALTNSSVIRPLLAWKVKKDLAKKRVSEKHYPAFFAVLDNFEKTNPNAKNAMEVEATSMEKVLEHSTARNLVRVFGLQEKLKAFAKGVEFKAKHVHVIGAGTMGADIAAWCAFKGMTVTLQDREMKYIAPAFERAHKLFKKRLKKPRLIQAAMDRISPDVEGRGVKHADVIIEAIFENLEAKQALFTDLEMNAKKDCVLATNTSTFPLGEISSVLKQPNRLVGIHFFNPVPQMMLVEVVKEEQTDKTAFDKALAFVGQIGKLPLPVKSSPGFLVNRVLMPYLMECVALFDEGIPIEAIDKAALNFGMPMGPVELADAVGLDICLHAADSLGKHFPVKVPQTLRDMVAKGDLGKKSGKGFYQYKNGKMVKSGKGKDYKAPDDIAARLILRLVNEAVACLREEVVDDADLVDAGMIFGAGFAPFRGGPMNYLTTEGAKEMKQQLNDLEKRYGDRFNPDTGWENLAHISH